MSKTKTPPKLSIDFTPSKSNKKNNDNELICTISTTKNKRKSINNKFSCLKLEINAPIKIVNTTDYEKNCTLISTSNSKLKKESIYFKLNSCFDCKYEPQEVLFRDKEMNSINDFIQSCLNNKENNRNLLISGKPGCGKTLAVINVIEKKFLEKVKFIKINAMNFKNPMLVFTKIFDELTNSSNEEIIGFDFLKNYFQTIKENIVLMIDEIDSLFFNSSNDKILDVFRLSNLKNSKLMMIGISNSMELLYKIGDKYKTNLHNIKNIVFPSYSAEQLLDMISARINEFANKFGFLDIKENIFERNAVRLLASKIYNIKGGDMRSVFDIISKTLMKKSIKNRNISEFDPISIKDLMETFNETNNKSKYYEIIETLPQTQQLALISIYLEDNNEEKSENIKFCNLMKKYNMLSDEYFSTKIDGFGFVEVLTNLQNYDLISLSNAKGFSKGKGIMMGEKIMIVRKINNEDIKFILSKNEIFTKYFK